MVDWGMLLIKKDIKQSFAELINVLTGMTTACKFEADDDNIYSVVDQNIEWTAASTEKIKFRVEFPGSIILYFNQIQINFDNNGLYVQRQRGSDIVAIDSILASKPTVINKSLPITVERNDVIIISKDMSEPTQRAIQCASISVKAHLCFKNGIGITKIL